MKMFLQQRPFCHQCCHMDRHVLIVRGYANKDLAHIRRPMVLTMLYYFTQVARPYCIEDHVTLN